MIHVKNHRHAQGHADKARRIALATGSCLMTGPPRHLRKVKAALGDDLYAFLGDDDDGRTVLVVEAEPDVEKGGQVVTEIPEGA